MPDPAIVPQTWRRGYSTLRLSVKLCFKVVEPEVKVAPKVSA